MIEYQGGDDMLKRPDYGNATPEDLARALMRPRRSDGAVQKQRPAPSQPPDAVDHDDNPVHEAELADVSS